MYPQIYFVGGNSLERIQKKKTTKVIYKRKKKTIQCRKQVEEKEKKSRCRKNSLKKQKKQF